MNLGFDKKPDEMKLEQSIKKPVASSTGMSRFLHKMATSLCSDSGKDCLRRLAALASMILLWLLAVGIASLFFPQSASGSSSSGSRLPVTSGPR